MIDELRDFVPNVHFELIPIRDLVSNQEYQRNLSWGHVKKAVDNFDLNQINPIKVSRRNGTNYVFNGQHTAEIVAAVSGSRDTPVWCMIYDELDYEQEADIFANQMKNVKPLSPYDVFNGHCQAGNDKELLIKGLVESFNLQVSSKTGPGLICAVGALESIFDKYGYEMLEKVLGLIIMTWEGEQKSFSANIMNGMARFLYSYQDKVSETVFKEKLGIISIKELTKTAKERKAGSLGFAEAMLIYYNKRLKCPLPWNELYEIRIDRKKNRKNSSSSVHEEKATSKSAPTENTCSG